MPVIPDTEQPQAPPAPPAPPTDVRLGEVLVAITPPGRALNRAAVEALKLKRSELSRQLISVQERRDEVAKEIRRASEGPARTGLEQRITVLDQRIMQIEQDIAFNGRELARAPLELAGGTSDSPGFAMDALGSAQITAISIVFTLAVLMPMAIAAGKALLRRTNQPKPAPQILESAQRLERMEQAVDAISIEIERISEGQRFVTQLLSKAHERQAIPPSVDSPR